MHNLPKTHLLRKEKIQIALSYIILRMLPFNNIFPLKNAFSFLILVQNINNNFIFLFLAVKNYPHLLFFSPFPLVPNMLLTFLTMITQFFCHQDHRQQDLAPDPP